MFTKNRDRLLNADIAKKLMTAILAHETVAPLLSDDHFSVDGKLVEAWASFKSFKPKAAGIDAPPPPDRPPAAGSSDGTDEAKVQTRAERREKDTLQAVHWMVSLCKRWLIGTHAGAVRRKHLQAYLDEFAFRHNRRKTNGVTRVAARHGASAGQGDEALPLVRSAQPELSR